MKNMIAVESSEINHTCLCSSRLTLGGCLSSGGMIMFAYLVTKYIIRSSFSISKTVTTL